jgi:hypothetical protein
VEVDGVLWAEYELEIQAIEESGNQTFTTIFFEVR